MVRMPQGHCIDSTEVTRDQYALWLKASPPTSGQDSWCSWNDSFAPDATCMSGSNVCQGGACGNHPQVCVDWCDAFAYCKAVQKRLCGKIGAGANVWGDYADATKDQWFSACSSGGVHNFPYGGDPKVSTSDGYDALKCNGDGKKVGTTLPVGTCPDCKSSEAGYMGVFDLSGNVQEWMDSCNGTAGKTDYCRHRGGSFYSGHTSGSYLRCGVDDSDMRDAKMESYGFRCCAP